MVYDTHRKEGHAVKINEVEAQVGIAKRNIRFYEKEGLLTPARKMCIRDRHYITDRCILSSQKLYSI